MGPKSVISIFFPKRKEETLHVGHEEKMNVHCVDPMVHKMYCNTSHCILNS